MEGGGGMEGGGETEREGGEEGREERGREGGREREGVGREGEGRERDRQVHGRIKKYSSYLDGVPQYQR